MGLLHRRPEGHAEVHFHHRFGIALCFIGSETSFMPALSTPTRTYVTSMGWMP